MNKLFAPIYSFLIAVLSLIQILKIEWKFYGYSITIWIMVILVSFVVASIILEIYYNRFEVFDIIMGKVKVFGELFIKSLNAQQDNKTNEFMTLLKSVHFTEKDPDFPEPSSLLETMREDLIVYKPKLVSNKIHNRHKSDSSLYQEQEISIMKAKSFNTQKVISNTPNYATPIILGFTVVYAVIRLFL